MHTHTRARVRMQAQLGLTADEIETLKCSEIAYQPDDYNYNLQEQRTKREKRESDGLFTDVSKPRVLF